MESILIKVKALNTCKTNINYGIELRKLIQIEFEINNFLNSGIFYINSIIGEFEKNKEYFFRISLLDKEEENKFAKVILKNKICNTNYKIKNLIFSIEEIIYRDSPWSFSYIPNYKYEDKIKIEIQSPCLIKVGSMYLNYIDKEIFFLKMINNYKKYIKKTFDKHQLLDLVNAIKFETNIKSIKIKYNNSDLVALKGEILLEMSNLEESMRNECFELISSIKFLGIGDRIEDGMGQVKVIE